MNHIVKSLYVEIKREEYDALRARVAEMESTLLRVVDTGELSRGQHEGLEADVCALTKAQQPSVVLPELRQVVTDALMGMIAAITSTTPPADQPPPPFIQSAIDRAVDRIARLNASAVAVQVQTCKLGIYGKAYDAPGDCRAYTYADQPGNVGASRLGEAARDASKNKGGDSIDYGLGLLKSLQEQGFGVFELATPSAQQKEPGDE